MSYVRIALASLLVGVVVAPASRAQGLEDLKAIFNGDVEALNAHKPDAFVASAHDGIIIFGILSPFPVDGKEEFRKVMRQYLEDYAEVAFTPTNPEFSVSRDSGIAWGHYALVTKTKDGPREYAYGRYSMAYTNTGGKWALAAMHLSPLQPSYYMDF